MELSKIVKIYRDIEKKINLRWTETEKAMFIYMQLCNRMEYCEVSNNKKDCARGIGGLLYNKAVCSGFAMIYKEALDRIGIECHYQNNQDHHSWNVAKLDGKYRALELTWDVYNKGKNGCGFVYFNRDNEICYSNPHHDISKEKEEKQFDIVPYTIEELNKAYATICDSKIKTFSPTQDNQVIILIGKDNIVIFNQNGVIKVNAQNIVHREFVRSNGTSFAIIQGNLTKNGLYSHAIIEIRNNIAYVTNIYSEEELAKL